MKKEKAALQRVFVDLQTDIYIGDNKNI